RAGHSRRGAGRDRRARTRASGARSNRHRWSWRRRNREPGRRAGFRRFAPGSARIGHGRRECCHPPDWDHRHGERGAAWGDRVPVGTMKISRITAWQVDLPLHEGAYKWSGGKSVTVFDSTVIAVETDSGLTGWGEVCPLGPAYLAA